MGRWFLNGPTEALLLRLVKLRSCLYNRHGLQGSERTLQRTRDIPTPPQPGARRLLMDELQPDSFMSGMKRRYRRD
jgi:hypothetical protein